MTFPTPYRGSLASFFKTVAYHEAGHAVVGLHFGISFRYVMLSVNGSSDVKLWRRHAAENSTRGRIEREIIILLAGSIAQERYNKANAGGGSHQDMLQAYALAADVLNMRELDCARMTKYMASMRKSAEAIVTECWPQIRAVAKELESRKRLACSDVKRICAAARTAAA